MTPPGGTTSYFPGTEPEPDRGDPGVEVEGTKRRGGFRLKNVRFPTRRREVVAEGDTELEETREDGSGRRKWRGIPLALQDGRRFETRVGVATLLSFVMLVCALVASSRKKSVEMAMKGSAVPSTTARYRPKLDEKPDQGKSAPAAPSTKTKGSSSVKKFEPLLTDPETPPAPTVIREPIASSKETERESTSPPAAATLLVTPTPVKVEAEIATPPAPSLVGNNASMARDVASSGSIAVNPPPKTSELPIPERTTFPEPTKVEIETPKAETPKVETPVTSPTSTSESSSSPSTIPDSTSTQAPIVPPPPREIPKPSDPTQTAGGDGWVTLPNLGKHYRPGDGPVARPEAVEQANANLATKTDDSPIQPVFHKAADGEDFAAIAKSYYGSTRYARALWSANRTKVATMGDLVAGTTIQVPPPEALDGALIASTDPAKIDSPASARVDSETSRVAGRTSDPFTILPVGRPSSIKEATRTDKTDDDDDNDSGRASIRRFPTYVAQKNDTFRSIARKTLGNSERGDEIRRLNLDIVDDPHRPQAGQKLKLPVDARIPK